jgi:OOP family OmpA-OmpF porin
MKQNRLEYIAAAALIACLFAASPLWAEQRAGTITLSPGIGGYVFDNVQDIEKDALVGLGVSYNFTKHWGAELNFNYGKFDVSYVDPITCDCLEDDLDAYMLRLEGLYHFRPEERLVPYLAAGVGNVWLDGDNYPHDDDYFTVNYGAGIKYDLTENIALRGDVRHIFAPDDSLNNVLATIGIAFQFGGAGKAVDAMETPAPAVVPAPVAPPPPATPVPLRTINLDIRFEFDSAVVHPEYHDRIRDIAEFMKAHPDTTAVIEGHTCSIGSPAYNMKLSLRRATSVKNYLVERFGIEDARLDAKGYGLTTPIASNTTATGRRQNRRVIVIIFQEGS